MKLRWCWLFGHEYNLTETILADIRRMTGTGSVKEVHCDRCGEVVWSAPEEKQG